MRYRRFGRTGWQISEVGYGMWGMGGWTGSDDEESLRALERAIALGCTCFDTAWVYGNGRSVNRWEPANVLRALDTGLIDSVQVVYNIFDQAPEDVLFPYCQEHDLGVIARVPFDEGSLTGTLTRESSWPEGDWRNLYFTREN